MSRSVAVLGAALAVSLLLNVMAFRRAREGPAGSRELEARLLEAEGGDGRKGPASAELLKAELERERKLARELQEKVKRLEADREVLAQAATSGTAPGAVAPTPAAGGLREKLRRMRKLFKTEAEGVPPDQAEVLEMSGEIMEVMKLGLARGKDPKAYAELLQACTEVALEEDAALTPDQSAELSRLLEDMAGELGRISAPTSGERLVRELEVEAAAVSRLQALLTPQQREVLRKGGMDDMPSMSSGMTTTYLSKANAAETIAKQWAHAYQLQDAQLPAARAAAESFLQALQGLDAGLKPEAQSAEINWGQMSYETRIAALRAQMSALRTLEGAMTGEQLDRLRNQTMREFRLMEFQTAPAPEKK